jgi:hypothetical protein
MKGIDGELGEMKIPLKLDANQVRHRTYRLNTKYKKKLKEKRDRVIEAGTIETITKY